MRAGILPAETGDGSDGIRLTTRFGRFEADGKTVVAFPSGLPGFEQCRRFVVLEAGTSSALECLMAVEGPAAAFLAMDPRRLLADYRCVLAPGDRVRLQTESDTGLVWLALLTVDADGRAFANLRAPVVINPAAMIGFQVVPQHSLYPLRHAVALG